jgi:hypothetical protein
LRGSRRRSPPRSNRRPTSATSSRCSRAPQSKPPRIGFLGLAFERTAGEWLRAGLRDLGYIEGTNIIIEWQWAQNVDELPALVAELVRMHVDVIFAPSSTFVEAARQATATIPIVFAVHADPVGLGHVAALARPGGNITGTSMLLTELAAKGLEMMAEALPQTRAVETAGEKLALELRMGTSARPPGLRKRVCNDGAGARRGFSGRGVTSGCWPPRAARRTRAQAPPAGDVPI